MFKCMTNRKLILQTQAHDVAIHAHFIPQTNFSYGTLFSWGIA